MKKASEYFLKFCICWLMPYGVMACDRQAAETKQIVTKQANDNTAATKAATNHGANPALLVDLKRFALTLPLDDAKSIQAMANYADDHFGYGLDPLSPGVISPAWRPDKNSLDSRLHTPTAAEMSVLMDLISRNCPCAGKATKF